MVTGTAGLHEVYGTAMVSNVINTKTTSHEVSTVPFNVNCCAVSNLLPAISFSPFP